MKPYEFITEEDLGNNSSRQALTERINRILNERALHSIITTSIISDVHDSFEFTRPIEEGDDDVK